jgi:hypothetical protein
VAAALPVTRRHRRYSAPDMSAINSSNQQQQPAPARPSHLATVTTHPHQYACPLMRPPSKQPSNIDNAVSGATPLTTVVLVLPAMQQQWASNVRIYSSTPPRLPSPLLMSAKSRLVSAFSMIASVRLFLLSRLCFTTRACSSADSIICA